MAAEEGRLIEWMQVASSAEGLSICPETGACFGVLERALYEGHIRRPDTVVIFNTGAAQKYVEAIRSSLPTLDKARVDWAAIQT